MARLMIAGQGMDHPIEATTEQWIMAILMSVDRETRKRIFTRVEDLKTTSRPVGLVGKGNGKPLVLPGN